jgi:hypothetical protein
MRFVLSLFCDGRVVEIFILRLVHLESGVLLHDGVMFFFVQVGSTELLWPLNYFIQRFLLG